MSQPPTGAVAPPGESLEALLNGLWKQNPVFAQALGLCPTLAVTNSVRNAIAMGHRDLMALPLEERVERGDSLGGLRWIGEAAGGTIRLRCLENLAKFRAGDALRLRPADASPSTAGIAVIYESHDDVEGVVTVSRDPYRAGGSVDPVAPLQLDPEATSLVELALEALTRLGSGSAPARVAARQILEGAATVVRDDAAFRAADAQAAASGGLDPRAWRQLAPGGVSRFW